MKILFIDVNKELQELARQESRIEVSNLTLDEVEADAISTCSNPDYDFAGGIDAYFAKRFKLKKGGEWLEVRNGDDNIENIVLNQTVSDYRKANYELVRKAYVNFLNLARNKKWETVVLTGFGTGVGGLSETDCIKALSQALDMIDTIGGKMKAPLIDIQNVIIKDCNNMQAKHCNNMQAEYCYNMQAKYCHNMQAESCYDMQAKYCDYMQAKSCDNMQAKHCNYMQAKYCDYMQAKSCDNMQAKHCNNMQAKYCYELQAKSCDNMQAKSCHDMQAESCNNMQAESCYDMQAESCNNMQAKHCDYMQAKYCYDMQAKSCHDMQAESCYELFLYKCNGYVTTCYTIQHKCNLKEINPKEEDDFRDIFLSQFKDNIAYKFLTSDWKSPIAGNKIEYEIGKKYKEKCDDDVDTDCSYGINLATLGWCLQNRKSDSIIVAFEFNSKDSVVPNSTDGKFRVSKAKCLYQVDEKGNRLKSTLEEKK